MSNSPDALAEENRALQAEIARLKAAEEQYRRREAQLTFLADLTEALATLNTASEIVTVFGQRVGEFLGTEACVFVEIDEAQNEAVVVHNWYRKGEFSLIGHYSLREYFTHAFQARMSAGQVMVVQDVMQDPRISDPAKFAGIHIGALVNVPLMRAGVWRFTFGLHHEQPYNWPDDEVALILEITTRLWNRLERIRAEEALLRRQAEIETLNSRLQRAMQETHHRIKNNLQTIAALVEMQGYSSAPSDEAAIHRINTHIRALATIHDLLTQQAKSDADLNDLNTHSMLGRLLPILQSSLVGRRIHAEIASLPIPVTQSAALTLLVNELISNAVKHTSGDIEIRLLLTDAPPGQAARRMARLEVCDHGPGFPPEFDPREAANTGLELIESAARWDLKGDILYSNRPEGGACVIVAFPLLSPLA